MAARDIERFNIDHSYVDIAVRWTRRACIAFAAGAVGLGVLDLAGVHSLSDGNSYWSATRKSAAPSVSKPTQDVAETAAKPFAKPVAKAEAKPEAKPNEKIASAAPVVLTTSSVAPSAPRDAQAERPSGQSAGEMARAIAREVARYATLGQDESQAAAAVIVPISLSSARPVTNGPAARIAQMRGLDAYDMAMTPSAAPSAPALTAPLRNMEIAEPQADRVAPAATPAPSVNPVPAANPAAPVAASEPAAPAVPTMQLASLDPGVSIPRPGLAPESLAASPVQASMIALIPLDKVPLPMPAPPPSPAERLKLTDKSYAKSQRCLANAIYFEARSEPVRGQMAVAQVVMNRVFSGFYPDNVCDVVYQNAHRRLACQFTFACDGKSKAIHDRGSWARANRIAKQTLDGLIYLPEVAKSTHYHAAYVHPGWAREMRKLARFGLHSFYRPYAWGNGSGMPVWGLAMAQAPATDKKKKTAAR